MTAFHLCCRIWQYLLPSQHTPDYSRTEIQLAPPQHLMRVCASHASPAELRQPQRLAIESLRSTTGACLDRLVVCRAVLYDAT
jgi:hypothetical protein